MYVMFLIHAAHSIWVMKNMRMKIHFYYGMTLILNRYFITGNHNVMHCCMLYCYSALVEFSFTGALFLQEYKTKLIIMYLFHEIARAIYDVEEATACAFDIILEHKVEFFFLLGLDL